MKSDLSSCQSITTVNLPLDFLNELAQSQSQQEILNCTAYWVGKLFKSDRASIALPESETTMKVFAFTGNQAIPLDREIPLHQTFVGKVYLTRQLTICADNSVEKYLDCKWLTDGGLLSCMDAPLICGEECYGTLNVAHQTKYYYQEQDAVILTSIAGWVSAQLQLQNKVTEAKALAGIDWLTGCFNRRAFIEMTEQLNFTHTESHALLMIDIDNFKLINDHYGHLVGDEVLKLIATTLKNSMREEDIFARIGGEEFALLLKNIPRNAVMKRAEIHRIDIQKLHIISGGKTISCTVSIGVGYSDSRDKSIKCLLARADSALYLAKARGKNQVVQAK